MIKVLLCSTRYVLVLIDTKYFEFAHAHLLCKRNRPLPSTIYIYSAMCLFIYYISNYSTYDLCAFMIISLVAEISTFEFLKL